MKKLVIALMIITAALVMGCEKEKTICTKTESVLVDGTIMKYSITKTVSFRGTYVEIDTTISPYGREIITIIEVDCNCN